MTQTLDQLSAAATDGEWIATDWQKDDGPNPSTICRTRKEELKPGQTSIWPDGIIHEKIADCEEGQHPLQDAAFICALVNAYRTGQLVAVADDAIERVARAIMLARDNGGCIVKDWHKEAIDNPHVEQAVRQAKAAIAAMKDTQPALAAKGTGDE